MKKHPPEVSDFIRANCLQYTARQMAAMSEDKLGFGLSAAQIKSYMGNHKIYGPRKGKSQPERRITTPEIDAFILKHHKGTGYQAMADMVNGRFGTGYTAAQMKSYYSRNHLNSGLTGQFQKNHTPMNKGKSWNEYMSQEAQGKARATTFQPGHIPHNGGAPIGTIRVRHTQKGHGNKPYYWQKVAQPNVWRMKHIVEWEAHNGPVPKGYIVTFANGDTLNWHIDNLILETRAQHAVKNRWAIHGYDQESAQTANAIADIKMAINKRKRKKPTRTRARREAYADGSAMESGGAVRGAAGRGDYAR